MKVIDRHRLTTVASYKEANSSSSSGGGIYSVARYHSIVRQQIFTAVELVDTVDNESLMGFLDLSFLRHCLLLSMLLAHFCQVLGNLNYAG